MFEPTWAICVKVLPPSAERSILNPVSLVALSVQARSMRVEEMGVAPRAEGALGGGPEVVRKVRTVDQADAEPRASAALARQ